MHRSNGVKSAAVWMRGEGRLWLEVRGGCLAGDWAEGQARDLAGPDEEDDDEAFGEVIDMETGAQPADCQLLSHCTKVTRVLGAVIHAGWARVPVELGCRNIPWCCSGGSSQVAVCRLR